MAALTESGVTKRVAYFCSACGSSSVEYGSLTGSSASCKACKWSGTTEQLMQHAFEHEHGSDTQVLTSMMNDLRQLYAKNATELAIFLSKWGFIEGLNKKEIARYLAAISSASLRAVIKVRQGLEEERVDGGS